MGIEEHELSNDQVLYWQGRLLQRKRSFVEAGELLKKHTLKDLSLEEAGEISRIRLHPADVTGPEQDSETLDSLLAKNLKGIQETEDALERLERGVFGVCQSCGEKIPVSRMEAIPETRFCLNCQRDTEEMRRASVGRRQKMTTVTSSAVKTSETVLISEVMQENPVTLRQEEGLDIASQLMFENNIRHLPVVDKRGDLQGIVSDRDLLCVFVNSRPWTTLGQLEKVWSSQPISSIMTKSPVTVAPDTSLQDAGTVLLDNNISCLPVVEGNRLVGIVTDTDFVKFLSR